jgi:hypothetical protein
MRCLTVLGGDEKMMQAMVEMYSGLRGWAHDEGHDVRALATIPATDDEMTFDTVGWEKSGRKLQEVCDDECKERRFTYLRALHTHFTEDNFTNLKAYMAMENK